MTLWTDGADGRCIMGVTVGWKELMVGRYCIHLEHLECIVCSRVPRFYTLHPLQLYSTASLRPGIDRLGWLGGRVAPLVRRLRVSARAGR